jgi:LysM repeat protein
MTADSAMNKFKKSVEDLKLALIPVGKAFLEAATPIVEFVGNILEKFGNLSDGTKRIITVLTVGIGAVGPIFLMTFGLIANALANAMKGAMILRQGYLRLTGQSQILGEQTQYLNTEQLEAAAAAHSLDQSHARLTQQFTAETEALKQLIAAYQSATRAGQSFMFNNPGSMLPPRGGRKLASGIVSVPGPKGAGDVVPAMLSPGEAVIPTAMAKKYAPLIQGMIADNIPGFQMGKGFKNATMFLPESINTLMGQLSGRGVATKNVAGYLGGAGGASMAPLLGVIARELKVGLNNPKFTKEWSDIGNTFARVAADALNKSGKEFIKDIDLEQIVVPALRESAKGINIAGKEIDVALENAINQIRTVGPVGVGSGSMGGIGRTTFAGSYRGVRGVAQKFALGQNPAAFQQTERLSQSRGTTVKSFQTLNPMLNKWEVATMSHITNSITASAEELTQKMTPYLGNVGEKVTKAITKDITKGAINQAKVASPSKETARVGADIARGFVAGAQEYVDDAKIVGKKLGAGMVQTASGLYVPGGSIGTTTSASGATANLSDLTARARLNREKLEELKKGKTLRLVDDTNRGFGSLNTKIMGGSFALTSFAGIASMAGGNLGKLSSIVFQLSGVAFALSTVLNILPNKFKAFLLSVKPGPLLLFTAALAAGAGIVKLINNAREKERLAIEGLGNAATLTSNKLKTLGGFFGVETGPSPFERLKTQKSEIQVGTKQRSEIEELRGDEGFQKEFKNDISTLKTATQQQAQLIFESIAIQLKGSGFANEQINNIIKALQLEANKTSVKIDLKNIDLTTEAGQAKLNNNIKALTDSVGVNFNKGMKTTFYRVVEDGKLIAKPFTELGDEAKKSIDFASKSIAANIVGLSAQLESGVIDAKQFSSAFESISNNIRNMPKPQSIALMNILMKNLPEDLVKSAQGISDVSHQLLLLQGQAAGVAVTSALIGAMLTLQNKGADSIERRAAVDKINEYKDSIKGVQEVWKSLSNTTDPFTNLGTPGKSAFEKAKDDLIAQQEELKNSRVAYDKLRKAGMDAGEAFEIAKDPILAAALATTKVGSEQWKTLLGLIKQVNAESKKTVLSPEETFDVLERSIEVKYRSAIKAGEAAVETAQKAVNDIEKEISGIQDSIEKKQRNIELTFSRPIEALQTESSLLSEQLEDIDRAAEGINAKYDLQEKALTKISEINQEIAEQEKGRLDLADALSRGDIAAAASAAQQIRADAAKNAIERSSDVLQAAREAEISGLRSATGLTKDQISARQLEIEKQVFALEQQKATATAAIRLEEDQIYTIQKGKLLTAQNAVLAAEKQLTKTKDQLKTDLEVIVQQKQFYEDEKLAEDARRFKLELYTKEVNRSKKEAEGVLDTILKLDRTVTTTHIINTISTGGGGGGGGGGGTTPTLTTSTTTSGTKTGSTVPVKSGDTLSGIASKAGVKLSDVIKANPQISNPNLIRPGQIIKIPGKMYGGKIKRMNMGGVVPKYFARGGRMGSDTVPAMLTPGEFVMNKKASQEFGPLLSMLNESKYPSMLGSSYDSQGMPGNMTSISDNSSRVYNYNIGITVPKSNSNPNDIARAVIGQIKYIDNQRIRGQK